MYSAKTYIGLAIFILIISFPFTYNNLGKASTPPKPELTDKAKIAGQCIHSKDWMRANHMQLLDKWRNKVVREGQSFYLGDGGKKYLMSLQNTCLDCHSNKKDFCDRCHSYMSVKPYCWTCHLEKE